MTHCRLSNGFGTTPKSKPPAWMGVHKTVNGAYRYRYAPFLMSTYYVMGRSPLALPLGELSPQVTERVLQPFSNDKINLCTHITEIPVVRGVSSPCEAAGHFLIEHCLLVWSLVALSVLATLGHLSQRERQGMLARYTERCIEVRPLSVRQIGIYMINFRFFGSLLFQKVFDINGEIIGEFMIHNLFSQ